MNQRSFQTWTLAPLHSAPSSPLQVPECTPAHKQELCQRRWDDITTSEGCATACRPQRLFAFEQVHVYGADRTSRARQPTHSAMVECTMNGSKNDP